MQSCVIQLDTRLSQVADSYSIQGVLDDASYELGDHTFQLEEGLAYDVVLTHTGEGILLTGLAKARVVGTCDRCLDEARFELSVEVNQYFLFEEPEEPSEDDDLDYELVSEDHTIDIAPSIYTALIMETPFIVLCGEDCKGLCVQCGTNLNHETCAHYTQDASSEPIAETNPFAVLASLKFDDPA